MRSVQIGILSILAFLCLLFLLSINPHDEDNRVVHRHEDGGVWMRKNHLLLPSQWRSVTPPTPNSATNGAADLNQKNFAGLKSRNQHVLLLSSLQKGPVRPPRPNPGQNAVSPTINEMNFAGLKSRNRHVLLPSLQKGPVTPPGPNPGQNVVSPTINEKSFADLKSKKQLLLPSLQKGPVTPPAPNPSHNSVSPTVYENNFVGLKSQKHLLLPSLQKGPVTPPAPNPIHNSVPVGEINFAGLKSRKNHILPPSVIVQTVTPPRTNPSQNSVSGKSFAGMKMATAHPPHPSLAPYILNGYLLS